MTKKENGTSEVASLIVRVAGVIGAAVSAFTLLVLPFIVTYDVVTRYFLHMSSSFAPEVSGYLLLAIGFMGASYTLMRGRHIYMESVVQRLNKQAQAMLGTFARLVGFGCASVISWQGWLLVLYSYRLGVVSTTPLGVPLYLPQLLIAVGSSLLALQLLILLLSEAASALANLHRGRALARPAR